MQESQAETTNMNWTFFTRQYLSMDELRKHYREMCLQYHPDKNLDNVEKFTEIFKQLLNEYDLFLEYFIPGENRKQERANSNTRYSYETESELGRKVADMMRYSGLIIEICGSWIWLSGNTFRWKDQIKQSGFRFQGKKKIGQIAFYIGLFILILRLHGVKTLSKWLITR